MRLVIANAASPSALWPSLILGIVLVLTLLTWALDHARLRRRLEALERSEAFRDTDLADARREVAALRDGLRHRAPARDTRAAGSSVEPPAPLS